MVKRTLLAWLAAVGFVVCAVPPAGAIGPDTGTHDKNPGSGGGQGNSAGGNPAHATSGACSLYSNSSGFGMWCITGNSGEALTVADLLGGDPAPTCWDDAISAVDAVNKYGIPVVDGQTNYLHSCLTGLVLTNSLWSQPHLQLNQSIFTIGPDPAACPRPYTDAMTGSCLMSLIGNQTKLVKSVQNRDGQIPGLIMATQPTTRVRTNQQIAFVDVALDASGHRTARTPDYQVGNVQMWAEMTRFSIRPYGAGTHPELVCNGLADVGSADTPRSRPDACWWTYPASSSGEPGQTYRVRAEADWNVYYMDTRGTHLLGSYQKYDDLDLPVRDVQTIVVN